MIHVPQILSTVELEDKAHIVCEYGKKLTITAEDDIKSKPKKPRPAWTAIGTGMTTRHYTSFPYEETLLKLTANEAKMYSLILKAYDRNTGYSIVDLSGFSQSEKNKLSLGYKALKARELVKRVKQKTYLINPTAKIHLSLFDELIAVWENTP